MILALLILNVTVKFAALIKEIRAAIDEDRFEEYRTDFLEKFHQGV